MPREAASTFLLLCCWELWKHSDVVFRSQAPNVEHLQPAERQQSYGCAAYPYKKPVKFHIGGSYVSDVIFLPLFAEICMIQGYNA